MSLFFAFVLQTGIRVGELTGLKWRDVDFENKTLQISRTTNQINGEWITGTSKSKSGTRDILLTREEVLILNAVKEKKKLHNIVPMQYHDTVFTSSHGKPIDNSTYNAALRKICDKTGIPHISMLRLNTHLL